MRSMAARIASLGVTHSFAWSPSTWRSSSTSRGFVGSAVATVTTVPSTNTGHASYWRRYLGERFFKTGSVNGTSSAGRKGTSHCVATALRMSSGDTAPRATSASPTRSCTCSARVRAVASVSGVMTPASTRVSPRLLVRWTTRNAMGFDYALGVRKRQEFEGVQAGRCVAIGHARDASLGQRGEPEIDHGDPQVLVERGLGHATLAPPSVHGEFLVSCGDDEAFDALPAGARPDQLDPASVERRAHQD